MCRRKAKKDYRTELEKKGKISYFTISDGAGVRVLDFDLAENPNEYIIFLIPGFITVFQSWQRVMKLLTPEYRVLYFESREKTSAKVPRELERKITLHRMALDIKEVVEQMNLDGQKYITLSSSAGGTILTEALSEKWINPSGAVMVGPSMKFHLSLIMILYLTLTPNFLIQNVFMPIAKWYTGTVYVNKKKEPEQYTKYVRAVEEAIPKRVHPLLRKMRKYQCWDMVPKIETKTLLLGASLDKMHSTKECLRVHELMPNSVYIDLGSNKATHDEPLVKAMKKFIEEELKKE